MCAADGTLSALQKKYILFLVLPVTGLREREESLSPMILLTEQLNACPGCVMEVVCPESRVLHLEYATSTVDTLFCFISIPGTEDWAMLCGSQNGVSIYVRF